MSRSRIPSYKRFCDPSRQSVAHTSTLTTRATTTWSHFESFDLLNIHFDIGCKHFSLATIIATKTFKGLAYKLCCYCCCWLLILGLGFVTSEKITPSPIAILGDISQAISIERRLSRSRTGLKDVLQRVVAEFNRLISLRRHRIDSQRKSLIYNLLRTPQEFLQVLHRHYDVFKHAESALPLDILHLDFYVPGVTTRMEHSLYVGKEQFQEILVTTDETCVLWATRAVQDKCIFVQTFFYYGQLLLVSSFPDSVFQMSFNYAKEDHAWLTSILAHRISPDEQEKIQAQGARHELSKFPFPSKTCSYLKDISV